MRTVVEARCHLHGSGGGTSANSAAALLPLIAIEMVAERTATPAEKNMEARLRRSFRELSTLTDYDAYDRLGYAMFILCRNGLAHSFYPGDLQSPGGRAGGFYISIWIDGTTARSVCVDEVGDRRASKHLVPSKGGSPRSISISAQHLCRDVELYVKDFLGRIREDPDLRKVVEKNERRVANHARQAAKKKLSAADRSHFGL